MQETTLNESVRETMNGFDGVWSRVTARTSQTAPSSARSNASGSDTLRELIRDERCAAQLDTCLARMFQGRTRAMLLNLAAQASQRARRLLAEYFINTGDSCVEQNDCDRVDCRLDGLRDAYERNMEASRAYERAAECTDSCELRALYERFSDETCAAAQTVRSMIVSCF